MWCTSCYKQWTEVITAPHRHHSNFIMLLKLQYIATDNHSNSITRMCLTLYETTSWLKLSNPSSVPAASEPNQALTFDRSLHCLHCYRLVRSVGLLHLVPAGRWAVSRAQIQKYRLFSWLSVVHRSWCDREIIVRSKTCGSQSTRHALRSPVQYLLGRSAITARPTRKTRKTFYFYFYS